MQKLLIQKLDLLSPHSFDRIIKRWGYDEDIWRKFLRVSRILKEEHMKSFWTKKRQASVRSSHLSLCPEFEPVTFIRKSVIQGKVNKKYIGPINTSQSWYVLRDLSFIELVKNYLAFYWIRRFIAVFTTAWTRWIRSPLTYPLYFRPVLDITLPSKTRYSKWTLSFWSSNKYSTCVPHICQKCYMSCPILLLHLITVSKYVTNGSNAAVFDVTVFLCVSLGSSTVQLYESR
jgi:hypothetical protein